MSDKEICTIKKSKKEIDHEEIVNILKTKIREVKESDWMMLPVFSYSGLDVFKNCPYQYNKKYNEKLRPNETTIALELGGLDHLVLEKKGKMLTSSTGLVDYNELYNVLQNGSVEINEKTKEEILGVNQLRKKYFEVWYEADNASGMNYEQKMEVFDKVLHSEMEDDLCIGWKPTYFEHYFEFVWDNRVIFRGFIDRIDVNENGDFRTVDYKTSKKSYERSKLATSLQFGIYALAILNEFDRLPVESMYRFILINEVQYALTLGWEKRLIKALDKIFDQIETCKETGIWKPNPTPLCYWCSYCKNNPDAYQYRDECEFYALWTPTKKTFERNKTWSEHLIENKEEKKEVRKLVF